MTQAAGPSSRRSRWRRGLFAIVSVIVFVWAARVLLVEFRSLRLADVEATILQWRGRLPLAVALCAASFGVVGLIEWRALRWARAAAPIGAAFKVSFIANGLAHSLGAAALVAGAARGRLYARHGVGLTKSAAITAFQTATSTCGMAILVAAAGLSGHGGPSGWIVGTIALGGVSVYLCACALARGRLRLWAYSFSLPSLKDGLVQVFLGAADNALAIGSLWVLLPDKSVAYARFLADYVIAYVAGALSGIPGGAGAFESLLVKLLPDLDRAGLGAALLGFRMIFNIAPLIGALALLLVEMAREHRRTSKGLQTGNKYSIAALRLAKDRHAHYHHPFGTDHRRQAVPRRGRFEQGPVRLLRRGAARLVPWSARPARRHHGRRRHGSLGRP